MATNSLKALLEEMDVCDVEIDASGMVRVGNPYLNKAVQSLTWEMSLSPSANLSCSTTNLSHCGA